MPDRANLTEAPPTKPYLLLTLLLGLLSFAGVFLLIRVFRSRSASPPLAEDITPTSEPENYPTETAFEAAPTLLPLTATPYQSLSATAVPSRRPTAASSPQPTSPTATLTNSQYGFSVTFSSSRQLYQEAEKSGTRFTFYHSSGIITLHAGSSWSWSHPGRELTSDTLVANRPSFSYDNGDQSLTDFESSSGTKFTLQCLHHGSSQIKSECSSFITNFKFSP